MQSVMFILTLSPAIAVRNLLTCRRVNVGGKMKRTFFFGLTALLMLPAIPAIPAGEASRLVCTASRLMFMPYAIRTGTRGESQYLMNT